MPRHTSPSHSRRPHTTTHHKTKTHVVTNTQILIATLALFLANGLALSALGTRHTETNQCRVTQIQYSNACKRNKYKVANYTCSDGSQGQIVKRKCLKGSRFQQYAEKACGRRQCSRNPEVAPAPTQGIQALKQVHPGLPDLSISQIIVDTETRIAHIVITNTGSVTALSLGEADEAVVIEWNNPHLDKKSVVVQALGGVVPHRSSVIEVAFPTDFYPSAISVEVDGKNTIEEVSETNNSLTGQIISAYPDVGFSGEKLKLSHDGSKVKFLVRLFNGGSEFTLPGASYTLEMLGEDQSFLSVLDIELGESISAGEEKIFETILPVSSEVRFVRLTLPREFSPARGAQTELFEIESDMFSTESTQ